MKTNDTTRVSDPLLPRGKTEIATSIDTAALRKCSMHELWLLHSALQTITDVICGFRWSPHFTDGAGNDVLDKINSFMCCYSDAAVRAAKTAEPATQREAEWQSWVILDNEARGADDLHDFAVLAASAARDVAAAAYSETHGRKGGAA